MLFENIDLTDRATWQCIKVHFVWTQSEYTTKLIINYVHFMLIVLWVVVSQCLYTTKYLILQFLFACGVMSNAYQNRLGPRPNFIPRPGWNSLKICQWLTATLDTLNIYNFRFFSNLNQLHKFKFCYCTRVAFVGLGAGKMGPLGFSDKDSQLRSYFYNFILPCFFYIREQIYYAIPF